MAHEKILIVDDDDSIRSVLRDRLAAHTFVVSEAENGLEGLKHVEIEQPDLILLDLRMPEMDGMAVLQKLNDAGKNIPIIVLTAHGSIQHAVEAMKLGAYDFLPKPSKPDHILLVVKKALDHQGLRKQNKILRDELDRQYDMLVGNNDKMRQLLSMAERVAASATTVLIGGASGTGKQLLARAIHNMSDRKEKSFVQVNCTTLNEQLLESDLFGHEKGAFTGALKLKQGRIELADKGTLFLDEIGDLTPSIQAKLLHVLEYNEFERVGGIQPIRVDVRIIAATHKDLAKEAQEGRFRQDLFYRLNVVHLIIPSLSERADDLELFVTYFLDKFNQAMGKRIRHITPDALTLIKNYHWPGNIRELQNAIERAVVLAEGEEITCQELPPQLCVPQNNAINVGLTLVSAVNIFKRDFIFKTLKHTDNNQTQAAKLLGIQRTYLNRLLKELEIRHDVK